MILTNKQNTIQLYIAIICIMAIFLGMLLGSMVAVSISTICFVANGVLSKNSSTQFQNIIKEPWYWSWLLVVLIVLVSGMYTNNIHDWQRSIIVKLSMLFLPFGFFACKNISQRLFVLVSIGIAVLIFIGSIYSLVLFLNHKEEVINNYNYAKVMATPFGGNHIYFSFTIAICILLLYKLLRATLFGVEKILIWLLIIGLVCYLHILAAKTGLLMFYISAIMILFQKIIIAKNKLMPLFGIALLVLLPFMAYQFSPTFKSRLHYIRYDVAQFIKADYTEGLSDGSRMRSMQAGLDIFKVHWIMGVGYGDVLDATNLWYNTNCPKILDYERMTPNSQLLLYAAGTGIIGIICCLPFLIMPFFNRHLKQDITWNVLSLLIAIFFSYETVLEGQFGVTIICFFILWWQLPIAKFGNKTT